MRVAWSFWAWSTSSTWGEYFILMISNSIQCTDLKEFSWKCVVHQLQRVISESLLFVRLANGSSLLNIDWQVWFRSRLRAADRPLPNATTKNPHQLYCSAWTVSVRWGTGPSSAVCERKSSKCKFQQRRSTASTSISRSHWLSNGIWGSPRGECWY